MDKEKNYEVIKDHGIVDENSSSTISIRTLSWFGRDPKLDIRVWKKNAEGEEYPSKGFSFLSENGPHRLTEKLVELGYGNKEKLQTMLDNRSESNSLSDAIGSDEDDDNFADDGYSIPDEDLNEEDDDDIEFFDPRTELVK